jgi:hypothetical protein
MTQPPEEPRGSADPTSVIVVDEAAPENSLAGFFRFKSPGGYTWWSGVILGVLGCCAFASMIIIHTKSNTREPPAVIAAMSLQQCPFLSSLLPPLAYEAWRTTCPNAQRGNPYHCTTSMDCANLGSQCADPKLLAQLQCVSADPRGKVCAYPSLNSTAFPVAPTSGFCTTKGTTCALCTDGSCGTTTTLSAGSIGCVPKSACSSGSWMCNP